MCSSSLYFHQKTNRVFRKLSYFLARLDAAEELATPPCSASPDVTCTRRKTRHFITHLLTITNKMRETTTHLGDSQTARLSPHAFTQVRPIYNCAVRGIIIDTDGDGPPHPSISLFPEPLTKKKQRAVTSHHCPNLRSLSEA